MALSFTQRILRPFAAVREKEVGTALLMFAFSFLSMTAHTILKPVTRSKFISELGVDNLPYVQLVAGLMIGVVMAGYSWLMGRLPRRWCLPIVQGAIAGLLVVFSFLLRTNADWVSVVLYFFGLILGLLLVSQFWTLANVLYDPRQGKRLFGFIGGGASLGGMVGSYIDTHAKHVASGNLLFFSAGFMILCAGVAALIIQREPGIESAPLGEEERGVGARKAIYLLQQSKTLRTIALVIALASIGAVIIDQQLNMAIEAAHGREATDSMTAFLATVQLWTSGIGLFIQLVLTSRIHRYLGIGFALILLPMSLGSTAVLMMLNGALWAPALARVLDQSLRYTVDKTTREILYMPLPAELKYEAKAFVDVTVDRFAKGLGAVFLLVYIKPWGLGMGWQALSYASIVVAAGWLMAASRARLGYRAAFRHSIESGAMKPAEMSKAVGDLAAIETLIQELASPDESRVLYSIDLLEALDKRNLITPLLLYHESAAVRVRALASVSDYLAGAPERWFPAFQHMISDESPEVRGAAVAALANMRHRKMTDLVQPLLADKEPRIAITAAMILLESDNPGDRLAAENMLSELVSDRRESAAPMRRQFAIAIRSLPNPGCRHLLLTLLHDSNPEVAEEALRSVRKLGLTDFLFVPALLVLLRNRRLKFGAREMLVGAGEPVLGLLGHFMRDPREDIWIRRHIPATIARIPCQAAMDILIDALEERDGFLRFKIISALERLHRAQPQLRFKREVIEKHLMEAAGRYFDWLSLRHLLFDESGLPKDNLLSRALGEKIGRTLDRAYRLLGLLYPWKDIAAARFAIENTGGRRRADALEYLDNLLQGPLRKSLIPILENSPMDARRRAPEGDSGTGLNVTEQALLRLVKDEDPVLAAVSIYFVSLQRVQSLQEEVENVLASRDPQEACVFEAASWALAGFRMTEAKRRALWHEPLPAVELAEMLRRLSLFASVTVDELFRIAATGRQIRYDPHRLLFQQGVTPDNMLILLGGRVAVTDSAGDLGEREAPAIFGFEEVFEGWPMRETVRAIDRAICLTLSGDELRTLMEENVDLLEGLFRVLYNRPGAARLVLKGIPLEAAPTLAPGGLTPIEKALILRTIPIFSDVTAEEMVHVAAISAEIPMDAGSTLFGEADSPALYALISGKIALESPRNEPALQAGAADVVGVFETLAGLPVARRACVKREGIALRIEREDLLDLLGSRPELLRQIFSALFRAPVPGAPSHH